jgi:hypothetical protein
MMPLAMSSSTWLNIQKFYQTCSRNTIEKHNQLRQGDLALEKYWLTQDPYFHLHTTIIGM